MIIYAQQIENQFDEQYAVALRWISYYSIIYLSRSCDSHMKETLIIIAAVIAVFIALYLVFVYIASDSFYQKKQQKAFEKSSVIRAEIKDHVKNIENNLREHGIKGDETDEVKELQRVIRECNALSNDGRRSIDRIVEYDAKLDDLESKALASMSK